MGTDLNLREDKDKELRKLKSKVEEILKAKEAGNHVYKMIQVTDELVAKL